MSRSVVTGSADQSIRVWAYNSSGVAITGEAYNSAGIAVSVVMRSAGRIVSTTALTLVARSVVGQHRDSAFTEVGSGEYVVDLPDSYSATAERDVSVTLTSTAISGGYVLSETLSVGDAGDADWAEEEREYILQQLALLTVSGASVVVTSGVYMCARGDVEQVYGNANTATWADLNNNQNSSEITSRINYHIAIADNYIRSVLTQGAWVMPVEGDTIPAILAYNCARLAGVLLYEGRGVSDYDSKGKPIHQLSHHKNGVDSFLKSVVYGSADLSPLVKSSTNEAPTAS